MPISFLTNGVTLGMAFALLIHKRQSISTDLQNKPYLFVRNITLKSKVKLGYIPMNHTNKIQKYLGLAKTNKQQQKIGF